MSSEEASDWDEKNVSLVTKAISANHKDKKMQQSRYQLCSKMINVDVDVDEDERE